MSDHHTPAKRDQPLPLLRNTTYPTYQLYAIAGLGKTPPEKVLTIAVLETLGWLRSRFRDLDVPADLIWPEASEYESFDLKSLRSFRIDTGYRVEVVWLLDEQIWALQLTEPDLGPQPGALVQDRPPVPGRLFETNVAFRIVSGQVECGFCTVVSDPEGTTAPCEVYRLAMIKRLARSPLVGLKQGWPIVDTAHSLERVADLNHLKEWLKDNERMMLAVIIAESVSDQPVKPSLPSFEDLKNKLRTSPPLGLSTKTVLGDQTSVDKMPSFQKYRDANIRHQARDLEPPITAGAVDRKPLPSSSPFPTAQAPSQEPAGQWLVDITNFAHYKMGYAQIFTLPMIRIPEFSRITGRDIAPGDVILIEPLAFGGEVERIPRRRILTDPDTQWRLLDERIQNAPKNKPMAFGAVQFLPVAKEVEQTNQIRRHLSSKEIIRASDERARASEQRHQAELQGMRGQHLLLEERIARLKSQIEMADLEKSELRDTVTAAEARAQQRLDEKDREIARLHALLERPGDLDGVIPWVENYFDEKLIFHQRAKKELESVAPGEVDLDLLCDALEYLATDYRDELLGLIDEDECRNRSSKKYDRGFVVSPSANKTIEMYPADYKIKYFSGYLGKPVDSLLDMHLKVGNTNEHLLRIYFLYDKEKKLIVIGSLPRHLSTVSYKS